jgi:hypothetical protein
VYLKHFYRFVKYLTPALEHFGTVIAFLDQFAVNFQFLQGPHFAAGTLGLVWTSAPLGDRPQRKSELSTQERSANGNSP